MININFRLNKGRKITDESIEYPIYLRYRLGRKIDFNVSIGIKVLPENWDDKKQVVKNRSQITNRQELNNLIKNLRNHFETFESKNIESGIIPTYNEVKEYYNSFFEVHEDKQELPENNLFTFIESFIVESERTNRVKYNTTKDYRLTKNTLQLFNDEVYKINFDNVDLSWYYDFIEWCNLKGFKDNYTGKHIKTLKTFLNNALENDIEVNLDFKKRRFKVFDEEVEDVFLNEKELNDIWTLDLKNNPRYELVRDLFLIGCYTGLRVSDYNHIKKENIKTEKGIKMITIKTKKTERKVAIPLHPIVNQILSKNNYEPLKNVPVQKLNETIKIICRTAKITEKVEINYKRSGKNVSTLIEKCELITSHTARRSFCTNAYLSGVDTLDIMSISGHKSEKNFRKYIKVTAEGHAIKMAGHKFFSTSNNLKIG